MFTLPAALRRHRPRSARTIAAVAGVVASVTLSAGPAPAAPATGTIESVIVKVDHAKVVRLPEKAQTVIVGNPAIADVAVQKNGVMIVTGKSFGVTNLIALDASGTLLAESLVRVGADSDSVLTVQRGLERESYSCTPVCQPAAQLGDAQKYFGEVGSQASSRNGAALGASKR
ncbi:pilus assembly protein N-terminal domain-containing protein [Bosea sp. R86505]|uniref:pilus assembly protein N-terminal domain-containing protein n=1 Tax=Bosea sp. R86505 TaxID=3101710 RepID=UPI0036715D7E